MAVARLVIAAALPMLSCFGPRPTAEDERRLEVIQQAFRGTYTFEFRWDCLAMESERSETVTREEGERVFTDFFMDGDRRREDTHFAFLNTYGRDGRFQYRMYWNPRTLRLESNNAESY